jgi:hypothetical protein
LTEQAREAVSATSKNIRFLSFSDQGGRSDGAQVMVHKGHAFIGHMFSNGISVIDVRDPRAPKPRAFVPMPPNTRSHHIQVHGDLLLAVNAPNVWAMQQYSQAKNYSSQSLADSFKDRSQQFATGLRIYDIGKPDAPREISFLSIEGLGLNRIWWAGGRHAYVSVHMEGFTDHIMAAIDITDPERPTVAGRWWLPGMWRAGGEQETAPKGKRYAAHHSIVAGNIAYGAWRDGGLSLHDVTDPANAKLLSHVVWSPPFAGGTHTPLPLPDRNLVVVADEPTAPGCADGLAYTWIFDVRVPERPIPISTLPTPEEENFCAKGAKFGPHNLHENRPGTLESSNLIFATYHNAGLRIYDIADAFRPKEVAYYVPPAPERIMDPRPNTPKIVQSCDVFADAEGRIYVTDANAGLHILQYEGA